MEFRKSLKKTTKLEESLRDALDKILSKSTSHQWRIHGINQLQQIFQRNDYDKVTKEIKETIEEKQNYYQEDLIMELLGNLEVIKIFANDSNGKEDLQDDNFFKLWELNQMSKTSQIQWNLIKFIDIIDRNMLKKHKQQGFNQIKKPVSIKNLVNILQNQVNNKLKSGLDSIVIDSLYEKPLKKAYLQNLNLIINTIQKSQKRVFFEHMKLIIAQKNKHCLKVAKMLQNYKKKQVSFAFKRLFQTQQNRKHLMLPLAMLNFFQKKEQKRLTSAFYQWKSSKNEQDIKKFALQKICRHVKKSLDSTMQEWKKQSQLQKQKDDLKKASYPIKGKILIKSFKQPSSLDLQTSFQRWNIIANMVKRSVFQFTVYSRLTKQNSLIRLKSLLKKGPVKRTKMEMINQGLLYLLLTMKNIQGKQMNKGFNAISAQRHKLNSYQKLQIKQQCLQKMGKLANLAGIRVFQALKDNQNHQFLKEQKQIFHLSSIVNKKKDQNVQEFLGKLRQIQGISEGKKEAMQRYMVYNHLNALQNSLNQWAKLNKIHQISEYSLLQKKNIDILSQVIMRKIQPKMEPMFRKGENFQEKLNKLQNLMDKFSQKNKGLQAYFINELVQITDFQLNEQEQLEKQRKMKNLASLNNLAQQQNQKQLQKTLHFFKQNAVSQQSIIQLFYNLHQNEKTKIQALLNQKIMKNNSKASQASIFTQTVKKMMQKRLAVTLGHLKNEREKGLQMMKLSEKFRKENEEYSKLQQTIFNQNLKVAEIIQQKITENFDYIVKNRGKEQYSTLQILLQNSRKMQLQHPFDQWKARVAELKLKQINEEQNMIHQINHLNSALKGSQKAQNTQILDVFFKNLKQLNVKKQLLQKLNQNKENQAREFLKQFQKNSQIDQIQGQNRLILQQGVSKLKNFALKREKEAQNKLKIQRQLGQEKLKQNILSCDQKLKDFEKQGLFLWRQKVQEARLKDLQKQNKLKSVFSLLENQLKKQQIEAIKGTYLQLKIVEKYTNKKIYFFNILQQKYLLQWRNNCENLNNSNINNLRRKIMTLAQAPTRKVAFIETFKQFQRNQKENQVKLKLMENLNRIRQQNQNSLLQKLANNEENWNKELGNSRFLSEKLSKLAKNRLKFSQDRLKNFNNLRDQKVQNMLKNKEMGLQSFRQHCFDEWKNKAFQEKKQQQNNQILKLFNISQKIINSNFEFLVFNKLENAKNLQIKDSAFNLLAKNRVLTMKEALERWRQFCRGDLDAEKEFERRKQRLLRHLASANKQRIQALQGTVFEQFWKNMKEFQIKLKVFNNFQETEKTNIRQVFTELENVNKLKNQANNERKMASRVIRNFVIKRQKHVQNILKSHNNKADQQKQRQLENFDQKFRKQASFYLNLFKQISQQNNQKLKKHQLVKFFTLLNDIEQQNLQKQISHQNFLIKQQTIQKMIENLNKQKQIAVSIWKLNTFRMNSLDNQAYIRQQQVKNMLKGLNSSHKNHQNFIQKQALLQFKNWSKTMNLLLKIGLKQKQRSALEALLLWEKTALEEKSVQKIKGSQKMNLIVQRQLSQFVKILRGSKTACEERQKFAFENMVSAAQQKQKLSIKKWQQYNIQQKKQEQANAVLKFFDQCQGQFVQGLQEQVLKQTALMQRQKKNQTKSLSQNLQNQINQLKKQGLNDWKQICFLFQNQDRMERLQAQKAISQLQNGFAAFNSSVLREALLKFGKNKDLQKRKTQIAEKFDQKLKKEHQKIFEIIQAIHVEQSGNMLHFNNKISKQIDKRILASMKYLIAIQQLGTHKKQQSLVILVNNQKEIMRKYIKNWKTIAFDLKKKEKNCNVLNLFQFLTDIQGATLRKALLLKQSTLNVNDEAPNRHLQTLSSEDEESEYEKEIIRNQIKNSPILQHRGKHKHGSNSNSGNSSPQSPSSQHYYQFPDSETQAKAQQNLPHVIGDEDRYGNRTPQPNNNNVIEEQFDGIDENQFPDAVAENENENESDFNEKQDFPQDQDEDVVRIKRGNRNNNTNGGQKGNKQEYPEGNEKFDEIQPQSLQSNLAQNIASFQPQKDDKQPISSQLSFQSQNSADYIQKAAIQALIGFKQQQTLPIPSNQQDQSSQNNQQQQQQQQQQVQEKQQQQQPQNKSKQSRKKRKSAKKLSKLQQQQQQEQSQGNQQQQPQIQVPQIQQEQPQQQQITTPQQQQQQQLPYQASVSMKGDQKDEKSTHRSPNLFNKDEKIPSSLHQLSRFVEDSPELDQDKKNEKQAPQDFSEQLQQEQVLPQSLTKQQQPPKKILKQTSISVKDDGTPISNNNKNGKILKQSSFSIKDEATPVAYQKSKFDPQSKDPKIDSNGNISKPVSSKKLKRQATIRMNEQSKKYEKKIHQGNEFQTKIKTLFRMKSAQMNKKQHYFLKWKHKIPLLRNLEAEMLRKMERQLRIFEFALKKNEMNLEVQALKQMKQNADLMTHRAGFFMKLDSLQKEQCKHIFNNIKSISSDKSGVQNLRNQLISNEKSLILQLLNSLIMKRKRAFVDQLQKELQQAQHAKKMALNKILEGKLQNTVYWGLNKWKKETEKEKKRRQQKNLTAFMDSLQKINNIQFQKIMKKDVQEHNQKEKIVEKLVGRLQSFHKDAFQKFQGNSQLQDMQNRHMMADQQQKIGYLSKMFNNVQKYQLSESLNKHQQNVQKNKILLDLFQNLNKNQENSISSQLFSQLKKNKEDQDQKQYSMKLKSVTEKLLFNRKAKTIQNLRQKIIESEKLRNKVLMNSKLLPQHNLRHRSKLGFKKWVWFNRDMKNREKCQKSVNFMETLQKILKQNVNFVEMAQLQQQQKGAIFEKLRLRQEKLSLSYVQRWKYNKDQLALEQQQAEENARKQLSNLQNLFQNKQKFNQNQALEAFHGMAQRNKKIHILMDKLEDSAQNLEKKSLKVWKNEVSEQIRRENEGLKKALNNLEKGKKVQAFCQFQRFRNKPIMEEFLLQRMLRIQKIQLKNGIQQWQLHAKYEIRKQQAIKLSSFCQIIENAAKKQVFQDKNVNSDQLRQKKSTVNEIKSQKSQELNINYLQKWKLFAQLSANSSFLGMKKDRMKKLAFLNSAHKQQNLHTLSKVLVQFEKNNQRVKILQQRFKSSDENQREKCHHLLSLLQNYAKHAQNIQEKKQEQKLKALLSHNYQKNCSPFLKLLKQHYYKAKDFQNRAAEKIFDQEKQKLKDQISTWKSQANLQKQQEKAKLLQIFFNSMQKSAKNNLIHAPYNRCIPEHQRKEEIVKQIRNKGNQNLLNRLKQMKNQAALKGRENAQFQENQKAKLRDFVSLLGRQRQTQQKESLDCFMKNWRLLEKEKGILQNLQRIQEDHCKYVLQKLQNLKKERDLEEEKLRNGLLSVIKAQKNQKLLSFLQNLKAFSPKSEQVKRLCRQKLLDKARQQKLQGLKALQDAKNEANKKAQNENLVNCMDIMQKVARNNYEHCMPYSHTEYQKKKEFIDNEMKAKLRDFLKNQLQKLKNQAQLKKDQNQGREQKAKNALKMCNSLSETLKKRNQVQTLLQFQKNKQRIQSNNNLMNSLNKAQILAKKQPFTAISSLQKLPKILPEKLEKILRQKQLKNNKNFINKLKQLQMKQDLLKQSFLYRKNMELDRTKLQALQRMKVIAQLDKKKNKENELKNLFSLIEKTAKKQLLNSAFNKDYPKKCKGLETTVKKWKQDQTLALSKALQNWKNKADYLKLKRQYLAADKIKGLQKLSDLKETLEKAKLADVLSQFQKNKTQKERIQNLNQALQDNKAKDSKQVLAILKSVKKSDLPKQSLGLMKNIGNLSKNRYQKLISHMKDCQKKRNQKIENQLIKMEQKHLNLVNVWFRRYRNQAQLKTRQMKQQALTNCFETAQNIMNNNLIREILARKNLFIDPKLKAMQQMSKNSRKQLKLRLAQWKELNKEEKDKIQKNKSRQLQNLENMKRNKNKQIAAQSLQTFYDNAALKKKQLQIVENLDRMKKNQLSQVLNAFKAMMLSSDQNPQQIVKFNNKLNEIQKKRKAYFIKECMKITPVQVDFIKKRAHSSLLLKSDKIKQNSLRKWQEETRIHKITQRNQKLKDMMQTVENIMKNSYLEQNRQQLKVKNDRSRRIALLIMKNNTEKTLHAFEIWKAHNKACSQDLKAQKMKNLKQLASNLENLKRATRKQALDQLKKNAQRCLNSQNVLQNLLNSAKIQLVQPLDQMRNITTDNSQKRKNEIAVLKGLLQTHMKKKLAESFKNLNENHLRGKFILQKQLLGIKEYQKQSRLRNLLQWKEKSDYLHKRDRIIKSVNIFKDVEKTLQIQLLKNLKTNKNQYLQNYLQKVIQQYQQCTQQSFVKWRRIAKDAADSEFRNRQLMNKLMTKLDNLKKDHLKKQQQAVLGLFKQNVKERQALESFVLNLDSMKKNQIKGIFNQIRTIQVESGKKQKQFSTLKSVIQAQKMKGQRRIIEKLRGSQKHFQDKLSKFFTLRDTNSQFQLYFNLKKWQQKAEEKKKIQTIQLQQSLFDKMENILSKNFENIFKNHKIVNPKRQDFMKKKVDEFSFATHLALVKWNSKSKNDNADFYKQQLPNALQKLFKNRLQAGLDSLLQNAILQRNLEELQLRNLMDAQNREKQLKELMELEQKRREKLLKLSNLFANKDKLLKMKALQAIKYQAKRRDNIQQFLKIVALIHKQKCDSLKKSGFAHLLQNWNDSKLLDSNKEARDNHRKNLLMKIIYKYHYTRLQRVFNKWNKDKSVMKNRVLMVQFVDIDRIIRKNFNDAYYQIQNFSRIKEMKSVQMQCQGLNNLVNMRKKLVLKKMQQDQKRYNLLQKLSRNLVKMQNRVKQTGFNQLQLSCMDNMDQIQGAYLKKLIKQRQNKLKKQVFDLYFKKSYDQMKKLQGVFRIVQNANKRHQNEFHQKLQFIKIRSEHQQKMQALQKFEEISKNMDLLQLRNYFTYLREQKVRGKNPWARKALHYIAKNQELNIQVSLWRLKSFIKAKQDDSNKEEESKQQQ